MEEDRRGEEGTVRLSAGERVDPADGGAVHPHLGPAAAALLHHIDPGRREGDSGPAPPAAGAGALRPGGGVAAPGHGLSGHAQRPERRDQGGTGVSHREGTWRNERTA